MKKEYSLTPDLKLKHWGEGEWVNEPDLVNWEYKNVKCKILRVTIWDGQNKDRLAFGHLCAYISVPEDHPWRNLDPFEVDCTAHGGITFGKVREDGNYWIGFDCMHAGDISPCFKELYERMPDHTYKNIAFCQKECENLVDQLLEANNANI